MKLTHGFTLGSAAVCLLAACYLYSSKQRTAALDREISELNRRAENVSAETAMLRMKWSLLNHPERLARLSRALLPNLRQTEAVQFTSSARLVARLDGGLAAITPIHKKSAPAPVMVALIDPKPAAAPKTAHPAVRSEEPFHMAHYQASRHLLAFSPLPLQNVSINHRGPAQLPPTNGGGALPPPAGFRD